MKKIVLVLLALTLIMGMLVAEQMTAGPQKQIRDFKGAFRSVAHRNPPAYTWTIQPTTLLFSYYDYMIGSYNGIPVRLIPDVAGGGYFMTFHGQRTSSGTRRVFYTYIDPTGTPTTSEITAVQNREGYPTIGVDPVSGKPIYAWHANADGTTDTQLEVQMSWDAFIDQTPGLFSDPIITINNPSTFTGYPPSNPDGITTSDNEFIWPTIAIGPSPTADKRRMYIIGRNSVTHTAGPSENPKIVYADFNETDIETNATLTWTPISIPEMDGWNVDSDWRRPFHSIVAGPDGKLYYAGFHFATDADQNDIDEEDLDVFVCDNYGQGTWHRATAWSKQATWNPPSTPTDTTGYWQNTSNQPYGPNDLWFGVAAANSGHLNATMDNLGNIHYPVIYALQYSDGYYSPSVTSIKEIVFTPATETFQVREIYPIDTNPAPNTWYTPWDTEEPWGVVDEYLNDPTEGLYPAVETDWPYPYWDETVHDNAMFFHCSNLKISEANEQGMMVCTWENSMRARMYNKYPADYPEYAAYSQCPEIYISVSPNNGSNWSEPIVINKVETTPQFANQTPMWVYNADKVKYMGTVDGHKVGRIGIMYYDDLSWGAYVISPGVGQNNGGNVKFMELEVTFPIFEAGDDQVVTPITSMLKQNYPNPFNPSTTISFNLPVAGQTKLAVYNLKGQLVKNLVDGNMPAGQQSITWNGLDNNGGKVTSGIYFYKLSHNGKTETRKMMLMK